MKEDTTPRNAEPLADWVNRIKPENAPKVAGQPAFGPNGLGWVIEGWGLVTVEVDEAGRPAAFWHAEAGLVVGYGIDGEGRRSAQVRIAGGDSTPVEGWPSAA